MELPFRIVLNVAMNFRMDAVHSDVFIADVFNNLHDIHPVVAFTGIQFVFVFPQFEETIRYDVFCCRFISHIRICQQFVCSDVGKKMLAEFIECKVDAGMGCGCHIHLSKTANQSLLYCNLF